MKRSQDLIGLVEAAYRVGLSPKKWLDAVAAAAHPCIDDGFGTIAYLLDISDPARLKMSRPAVVGGPASLADVARDVNMGASDKQAAARAFNPATPIATVSQALGFGSGPPTEPSVARGLEAVGAEDFLAVLALDPSGVGCTISTPLRSRRRMSARAQSMWGRVTTHILAGLRLRNRLSRTTGGDLLAGAEAVLEPSGKLAHAQRPAQGADARDALRSAALAIDRARGALRRKDPEEALDLWRGLVAGRWSLLDHFENDGRRYLVARRNEPRFRDPRALTPRERQVIGYVALGHANKLVAYALGVSESDVSTHLARATRKLGVQGRAQLIDLLARLRAAGAEPMVPDGDLSGTFPPSGRRGDALPSQGADRRGPAGCRRGRALPHHATRRGRNGQRPGRVARVVGRDAGGRSHRELPDGTALSGVPRPGPGDGGEAAARRVGLRQRIGACYPRDGVQARPSEVVAEPSAKSEAVTGPQTCPRCGGAVEPDRDVEELVREGDDVAVVRVCADVCGECGEALFHPNSVERLLDARKALRRAAASSAPVIGRVYDYRSAG